MFSKTPRLSLYFSTTLILCLFHGYTIAGKTTRVNVTNSGKQAISFTGGTQRDRYSRISADGRYVVFSSFAANLADDKQHTPDVVTRSFVYVRDLLTKKTELVSFPLNDKHYIASNPDISADGRYVVFTTEKYVKNTIFQDIYIHDRLIHKTELLNVGSKTISTFDEPNISTDGRYVAFSSPSDNLTPNDNNNNWDVFVYDRHKHKIERVSVASNGLQADGGSGGVKLSSNGRYVVFHSNASNLVPGDTNKSVDVFIHDRLRHKTSRVSVASNGIQAQVPSKALGSGAPCLSANGRYIAFTSDANNLVPKDTNEVFDVFVHDQLTNKTERVSLDTNGKQKNIESRYCSISADGTYVAFISKSEDNFADVFVNNRFGNKTEQINVKPNGLPGTPNILPRRAANTSISADGRYVTFDSTAANLVLNDTNDDNDIFVRDRLLDTKQNADLKIISTTKPIALKLNTQGTYRYTIINNGKDAVPNISLIHLVSGGAAVNYKPSQGKCSLSPVETVCHLGKLVSGKKLTLNVTVKAQNKALSQQLTVNGAPIDTIPNNNYVTILTPVK